MAVNDSIDRINIGGDERMIKPAASNVNVAQYTPSSGSAWNPGDVQEALEQLKEGKADLSYFGTVPLAQLPIEDLQSTLRNVVVGYFNGARNKFFDSLGTPAPYATDLLYVEMGTGIIYRWDGSTFETVGGAVSHENEQSGSSITDSTSLVAHDVVTVSDVKTAESRVEIKADGTITRSEMGSSDVTFNLPAESGTLATASQVAAKQDALVSGTNIKTVNNTSLLGSGNVDTNEFYNITLTDYNNLEKKANGGTVSQSTINSICAGIDSAISNGLKLAVRGAEMVQQSGLEGKYINISLFKRFSPLPISQEDYKIELQLEDVSGIKAMELTKTVSGSTETWDVSWGDSNSWASKQDTLVSGTNIKTVNSTSLLGSGNVSVNGVTNVSAPATADGTWTMALDNGDNITMDLNHVHPQYLKYELVQSLPASPDSDTLYLIAVS